MTVPANKDIQRQDVITYFALHTALVPPLPLRVPLMLTTDVFMISELSHDPIKSEPASLNTGIRSDFVIHCAVGDIIQHLFLPSVTAASFPLLATDIAELTAATIEYQNGLQPCAVLLGQIEDTYRHVIWLQPWYSSTIAWQPRHRCQFSCLAMARTFCRGWSVGHASRGWASERQGRCVCR